MYTIVLDVNKKYLGVTTESGKIRHLLKEQKIKVINKEPFTIQLLSNDDIELDIFNPKKGKIENNVDASVIIKNIEFFYGHLNQDEQIRIIPIVQDILSKAKQINEDITLLDVAHYLFCNQSEVCQRVGQVLKQNEDIDKVLFNITNKVEQPKKKDEDITESIYKVKYENKKAKCKELKDTIQTLTLEKANLIIANDNLKKDLADMEAKYNGIKDEFMKFKMQVQLMTFNIKENMVKPAKLGDDEGTDIGIETSDLDAFNKLLSDTNNEDNDNNDDANSDDNDDNCKK